MRLSALICLVLAAGCLRAGEISAGFETDFVSRYTWLGMPWSRGAAAQPYAWITAGGFTVSLWGNDILDHEPQRGKLNSADISAAWAHDFGRWRVEPAFEYWFDRPVDAGFGPSTGQTAVKLSWGGKSARIFSNESVDVGSYRGAYSGDLGVNLTASARGLDFESNIRQAWASAKFNSVYAGLDKGAPTYAGIDASATRHFAHGFYVRVHGEISAMEKAELRRAIGQQLLRGAGIAVGFEWKRK